MLSFRLFQIGETNFAVMFFRRLLNPSNCIHHLLPPPRYTEITSRLRKATITYPRPPNRTNCYKSFIHHALLKYQYAYITILGLFFLLHCIAFHFLSCIVLFWSTLFTNISGRQYKVIKREKKLIRCVAAQKIIAYSNIYKIDCPHC